MVSTGALVRWLLLAAALLVVPLATVEAAGKGPESVAELAAELSPAVVNVGSSRSISSGNGMPFPDFPEGSPLEDLFNDLNPNEGMGEGLMREARSLGSGFIISADGVIVTNSHVIAGAEQIEIYLEDGTRMPARMLGADDKTDLAVLKVDAEAELPFVELGDSDTAVVGDWVMAIGNPFGLGGSVTLGIVSARNRDIQSGPYDQFIQTDASINPGNSGGALVNLRGELVGINSAIISRTGGNIGIGFAVPTEIAGSIMRQILEYGSVRRGLLGVTIATIDPETAEAIGAEVKYGALVSNVQPDSAAEEAGLQVDDIIVKVDDERINNSRDLANAIGLKGPGDEVRIEYLRNGDRRSATAVLGERTALQSSGTDIHPGLSGALFATSTEGDGGVEVVDVEPRTPAAQRGLAPGDLIVAVNRVRVRDVEEMQRVAAGNDILFLLVHRDGRQLLLQIR